MKISSTFPRWLRIGLPLIGVIGGGLAGWLTIRLDISPRLDRLEQKIASVTAAPTSTAPVADDTAIKVIPVVERRAATPFYPSAFTSRRASPVLSLVKKPVGKNEEAFVGIQQTVSHAVTVTTDGWLVLPKTALGSARVSELMVVWNGALYPITSAVRDTAVDLVYLKINAKDLPVPAFVRATDVAAGLGVWVEASSQRLYPDVIADTRIRATETVSSEKATRHFLVTGAYAASAVGGAVWDQGGQLVGFLEAAETGQGWTVLPAGFVPDVLPPLLSGGEIIHPVLGVRGLDLSTISLENRTTLPTQGIWLHNDKRSTGAVVIAKGPADGLLKEGDVIEKIERDILDGSADLGERLLAYQPGATVTVYGKRKGASFSVQIKLGSQKTSERLK
ncbi:MAG: S1C family serine protease [bacterium]|nr:S1C family serine protease [bacterium]